MIFTAGKECPLCQKNMELVQSAPNMILLCRGCGTFFSSSLEKVGDLVTGLDIDKLEASSAKSRATRVVAPQPVVAEPAAPAREHDMMSALSELSRTPGIACPQCNSEDMRPMVSKVTGNTLYTCVRCGYTGTPMRRS